jgi:hypothetical protein
MLLALLLSLVLAAPAHAHVTKPGFSEIRQHGTSVTYVLGLESDALTNLAGGDSRPVVAGYVSNNVRMSVDGESCRGGMTRATPERHAGAAYTRVWLRFVCPQQTGAFVVNNEIPLDSVVDYELGGAHGTFLFDADHSVLSADSPGFVRFVEHGVEHILLGWDHVLFLGVLLLGAAGLRDVFKLATTFTVAHSVTLALAILGVVEVPGALVEPLIALSIAWVAAENVLGRRPKHRLAIVFAFGLLHGLGFAGAMTFADGTPLVGALIGFNLGIELGQALLIGAVFPVLLGLRRLKWSGYAHAAAGSAAAAMGLFWFSERVLGG